MTVDGILIASATDQSLVGRASSRPLRVKLYLTLVLGDMTCLIGAFVVAALIRFGGLDAIGWAGVAGSVLSLFLVSAILTGAYSIDVLRSPSKGIARSIGSLMLAFTLLFLLSFFLKADVRFSRVLVSTAFVLAFASIAFTRQMLSDWIRHRFRGRLTNEVVLCDGVEIDVSDAYRTVDAVAIGLRPDPRDATMLILLASILQGADRVVVACGRPAAQKWAQMLQGADIQGEILAKEFDTLAPTAIAQLHGLTTLVVSSGPLNVRQRMTKRVFDLALAVPAMILLAPALCMIAVLIRLDSPGPIFFKQRRVGLGNGLFEIYKFRSMAVERSDADGRQSARRDDDRITRVGKILRRTSADELPQLLNVLFGSMSIVGPRPHALGSLAGTELFWHVDERYWHRHCLKPGITGLAQVRGHRGATHTREDLTSRLRSDLEYVSGWSLWRDISIVARTARVLFHRNAY
jgi:exopolysaccharide biosynthesis polyprenyl glycosylphosphotransferase